MRSYLRLWPLLLIAALLVCPEAAIEAAKRGAALWWTRVFPSLLPFLTCCSLLLRTNAYTLLCPKSMRRFPACVPPVALLALISGYPTGAKLLGELVQKGELSKDDAERLSYALNVCSPSFLISIIACALFHDKRLCIPLFAAQYIVTALVFAISLRGCRSAVVSPAPRLIAVTVTADSISASITDALLSVARIGGCIVLCSVLTALLQQMGLFYGIAKLTGLEEAACSAFLGGILELTQGCAAVAELTLPVPLKLSLCAFLCGFGGFSVLLQSACFFSFTKPWRYVGVKALMGLSMAVLCYLVCLLLPTDSAAVFADGATIAANTVSALSLFVGSLVSLMAALLLTMALAGPKRSRRKRG